MCWVDPFALVFFRAAEKRLKSAKALKYPGGVVAIDKREREGGSGSTERGSRLESHRRREVTQRGSRQGGSGAHSDREGGGGKESR